MVGGTWSGGNREARGLDSEGTWGAHFEDAPGVDCVPVVAH